MASVLSVAVNVFVDWRGMPNPLPSLGFVVLQSAGASVCAEPTESID